MFTGIVQDTGQVVSATALDQGLQLSIRTRLAREGIEVGESICVSGACLTVEGMKGDAFRCFLSAETLARTTLGAAHEGTMVNLERALRLSDRLGGHLVTGHVDGVGAVTAWQPSGEAVEAEFSAPPEIRRYLAPKGSVAVDGVSLTVAASLVFGGYADKIVLMVAPLLIGGREAPTVLDGAGAATLREAYRVRDLQVRHIGDDLVIEGYLCSPA